jgi:hypothetical protein
MRWTTRLLLATILVAATGQAARCQTQAIQEKTQKEQAVLALSSNYLKQIGLAMHNYHDKNKRFPSAAIYDKNGKALLSWRVAILPYLLDEKDQALYKEFRLDEPWDSEHNKKLLDKMPRIYASPAAKDGTHKTYYQVITGPGTAFAGKEGLRIFQITDGTSNTILAVEAGEAVPWTKPADIAYDPKKPLPKLGGVSKIGINVLWFDGSTTLMRRDFDEQTFRDAVTPSGGEVIQREKLKLSR